MSMTAKLLTEFAGTFVFFSVVALAGPIGPLAPLAIGSMLMVMVYMGGHISGAHYNPAVSFAVFLRGRLTPNELLAYWVTQVLAGLAAFTFGYLVGGHPAAIQPGSRATLIQALAVETIFTAALVLVVLNTAATKATQGNSFYGLAIGFTIAAGAFAAAPISGGAFNPAVGLGATFSAALFAGRSWGFLWLYIAGPLIGASIGAAIHAIQIAGLQATAQPPQGKPSPGAPPPVKG